MCLLEFHPVLFFSSQNLQSSSSKASQSSSISFSSLSIESQLLQKIQNGYQRTSWGSFMNFVQMLVHFKYLPAYHGTIWSDEVHEKTKAVLNQFLEDSPLKSIIVHFSPWYHIWISNSEIWKEIFQKSISVSYFSFENRRNQISELH